MARKAHEYIQALPLLAAFPLLDFVLVSVSRAAMLVTVPTPLLPLVLAATPPIPIPSVVVTALPPFATYRAHTTPTLLASPASVPTLQLVTLHSAMSGSPEQQRRSCL